MNDTVIFWDGTGGFITGLSFNGTEPNIRTGEFRDAIRYTLPEAQEVCAALGRGARPENIKVIEGVEGDFAAWLGGSL